MPISFIPNEGYTPSQFALQRYEKEAKTQIHHNFYTFSITPSPTIAIAIKNFRTCEQSLSQVPQDEDRLYKNCRKTFSKTDKGFSL